MSNDAAQIALCQHFIAPDEACLISMNPEVRIGLVGDYNAAEVPAHQAIPRALALASEALSLEIQHEWVFTDRIQDASRVADYDGIWLVPGTPYRSMNGAMRAARFAREKKRPFLGTCGGFQYAIVEYARNVLRWEDAEHAELSANAGRAVISLLAFSMVEVADIVHFHEGSRIAAAYGARESRENYRCRYGLNPEYRDQLLSGPLRASAEDSANEVRAIELDDHPFFVATLFQPERAALNGRLPPLVLAFIQQIVSGRSQGKF